MTTQLQIDTLDELFHDTAGELHEALQFAYSKKSEGQTIEAFGKAVSIARRLVAVEDLAKQVGGDTYEGYHAEAGDAIPAKQHARQ